jgi:pimeloyl-CoA synthetase
MTDEELFEYHSKMCGRALDICRRKNHDYATGSGAGPFANFSRVEGMGVTSTEQGFMVRIVDKLSRLSTYAKSGRLQVSDEGVQDTLLDLLNYTVLLSAYIQDKEIRNEG